MKKLMGLAVLCALMVAGGGEARAGNPSPAFEKLKSLAGDWEGKMGEGHTAAVNYRVTSAGSVVVETIMPGEPGEMVTLFHRDGDSLVATHYCGAQNQPRMRASALSADGKEIVFKFLDVTNLASPDAEYMREVTFRFHDADHFTATWTSRAQGKDSPTVFTYARKK